MKICMIAAENGSIPGAKVGGLGDVVRDIPQALAELGHEIDVVMPGYQRFAGVTGAEPQQPLKSRFREELLEVEVSRLELAGGVRCWLLDHPYIAAGGPGRIYCDDPPGRPFATDASKFALFGAAACQLLVEGRLGDVDVIHLHDWHAAFVAMLARFDPRYESLGYARLVASIHNLAMQGIRPFADDESSLEAWFPELEYKRKAIADPRYPDCFNPMRAAINLCDKVHTVSPTYAREIRKSNQPEIGFHGGEGLERDLQRAHRASKLSGILNGCEYGEPDLALPSGEDLIDAAHKQVFHWIGDGPQVDSSHFIALERLARWRERPPGHWITSISRLTPQKTALFQVTMEDGNSCLENILAALPQDHAFVMLGSGDAEIEDFLTRVAARSDNFLFLKGYSEPLSRIIYALGALFLMPSSFEPCGIGQMLAMRTGQPCLAHRVGGLKDTIENDVDGFTFTGRDPARQSEAFVRRLRQALSLKRRSPQRWAEIRRSCAARRFSWTESAQQYCEQLYGGRSAG
ncbi:MAG: glycogen synthase [Gammaproteobacteria bacterium]|nr:glycogen synthase [Gammaproteobacteria bacterium]MYH46333.1 glycogen synthase [Gammaproteobacteria bacterium]MYL13732.1 glycogen synthase [Gammaproteobacteria bacterium]